MGCNPASSHPGAGQLPMRFSQFDEAETKLQFCRCVGSAICGIFVLLHLYMVVVVVVVACQRLVICAITGQSVYADASWLLM